jgi:aspartyl-tRNA(Asn)/glutamyl-tRNA(Gln) amidotransferase subunit A
VSAVDEISFATVAELGRMLRSGRTSPVELAEHFLERLDRIARPLNAVVTLTAELALAQAHQAEEELAAGIDRGPLHGIPYGAKDLLATTGIATTWGAAPYQQQLFDHDASVIARLREAGAVLVAKLAMVELAGGFGYEQPNAAFTGPCKNAWNPDAWAGGSSSGSGTAVAAGAVPFAIGTETWGSITCPAAYCGISGLRPTYGRVSRRGAMALSWTLDKIGPMAHAAEDCLTVLTAIAGPDSSEPTTIAGARFPLYGNPPTRFRIGVLKNSAIDPVRADVRANFEASLDVLAGFADLEEVAIPDLPYDAATTIILGAEAASAFEDFIDEGGPLGLTAPEDRIGGMSGMTISGPEYLRALRFRRLVSREIDQILARFDVLVAPTLPTVASPIAEHFEEYFRRDAATTLGAVGNLCGLPAISVPNGFGERGTPRPAANAATLSPPGRGLPTGLEFMGRAFADARVAAAAAAYQERTDWHRRRP